MIVTIIRELHRREDLYKGLQNGETQHDGSRHSSGCSPWFWTYSDQHSGRAAQNLVAAETLYVSAIYMCKDTPDRLKPLVIRTAALLMGQQRWLYRRAVGTCISVHSCKDLQCALILGLSHAD